MESASLYEKNASEESMARHQNWELYKERIEPTEIKEKGKYISLRMCEDILRLQMLKGYLESHKEFSEPTLMPWVSPPYGEIVGYGLYEKNEAEKLQRRADAEGWGYPLPGAKYDLSWFRKRIKTLEEELAQR